MSRFTAVLTIASLLALAALAHDGPHEPGTEHTQPAPDADASPDAAAALAGAKQRLERAEAAYTRMMSRDYPRGDARAKVVQERQDARAEWERLAAAHPELVPRDAK